ncbi:MAG: NYN domain-containing protein [Thermoplasmata archaeon]
MVDADNAYARIVREVLEEAAKYGTVIIRRAYGDWTSPQLASWKKVLFDHAISPIQQFANISGKNATDSALIIDAMDLLHGGRVEGFCIVSSDSDYTRLATRIRESGHFVLGVGRANTAAAFRNACNVFVAIENIAPALAVEPAVAAPPVPARRRPVQNVSPLTKAPPSAAVPLLRKAFDTVVREDGRATLSHLGTAVQKLDPAFDPRTYGRPRLRQLVEALSDVFILEPSPERGPAVLLVRLR